MVDTAIFSIFHRPAPAPAAPAPEPAAKELPHAEPTPIAAAPAEPEPVHVEPPSPEPEPLAVAPAEPEPEPAAPAPQEPIAAAPVEPEPVHAEPVPAEPEPVVATPPEPEPVHVEPPHIEPPHIEPLHVEHEPHEPVADPEPVHVEPPPVVLEPHVHAAAALVEPEPDYADPPPAVPEPHEPVAALAEAPLVEVEPVVTDEPGNEPPAPAQASLSEEPEAEPAEDPLHAHDASEPFVLDGDLSPEAESEPDPEPGDVEPEHVQYEHAQYELAPLAEAAANPGWAFEPEAEPGPEAELPYTPEPGAAAEYTLEEHSFEPEELAATDSYVPPPTLDDLAPLYIPAPVPEPHSEPDTIWSGPAELTSIPLEADQLGLANPIVFTVLARLSDFLPVELDASYSGIYRPQTFRAAPWSGFSYDQADDGRSGVAAGTRILTSRGELEVEKLLPGDAALSLRAPALLPIAWIGKSIATAAPIWFDAGALGPDLPRRPLCLAPDQPVYVDPIPVPAARLVNGTTICQMDLGHVDLFHVDVGRSEILFAEGVPLSSSDRSRLHST
ncbi:Hint domain-containing protein [Acidisphaera sp. L21]|uniref:Hint domain-containing protein n=1 Tax=Acidisphaera sp. L21 TaxID=1641851 RepID=UPI00131BB13A|nr:Hint domain-containing protein [Acidisphaera sp. L21]